MKDLPRAWVDLLNKTEPGWAVDAFCIPFPHFRVIRRDDLLVFRVEQLVLHNKDRFEPRGTWSTIATYSSETPSYVCMPAMQALRKARADLQAKVARRHAAGVQRTMRLQ